VGFRPALGPHFVQHDRQTGPRDLPGSFRSGQAAADDVNRWGHGAESGPIARDVNRVVRRSAWDRSVDQTPLISQ
jgi:hypothetical protein